MANIHSNISFGLVNIPIIMNSVIRDNDTSFHQLHNKCLQRVKYIKYCPTCKMDLEEKDIIKGYQYERDKYLIFEKEELDSLKLENDHEIEVVAFVEQSEISPIYFEKSYFLEAETKSKAYYLFYEALEKTNLVAVAKCVLNSKFYYCILRLIKEGIILTTLYFEEEITIPDRVVEGSITTKEKNLAIKLVNSMKGRFEPEKYKDEYQDRIRKAIDDKLHGKKVKGSKQKNKVQVDNLLDALEKSLKK